MTRMKGFLFGWLVLSGVLSFVAAFIFKSRDGGEIGFWLRLLSAMAAVPCGFIGAMIGDVLRRFSVPDAIFTTGGMFQIIRTKFFWLVGPQLIGLGLGIALSIGMIFKAFGVNLNS